MTAKTVFARRSVGGTWFMGPDLAERTTSSHAWLQGLGPRLLVVISGGFRPTRHVPPTPPLANAAFVGLPMQLGRFFLVLSACVRLDHRFSPTNAKKKPKWLFFPHCKASTCVRVPWSPPWHFRRGRLAPLVAGIPFGWSRQRYPGTRGALPPAEPQARLLLPGNALPGLPSTPRPHP